MTKICTSLRFPKLKLELSFYSKLKTQEWMEEVKPYKMQAYSFLSELKDKAVAMAYSFYNNINKNDFTICILFHLH
jgi:hypothetical protein